MYLGFKMGAEAQRVCRALRGFCMVCRVLPKVFEVPLGGCTTWFDTAGSPCSILEYKYADRIAPDIST